MIVGRTWSGKLVSGYAVDFRDTCFVSIRIFEAVEICLLFRQLHDIGPQREVQNIQLLQTR